MKATLHHAPLHAAFTGRRPTHQVGERPSDNVFDRYDRFESRSLQRGAASSYDFSEFDTSLNTAIDKGQRFSFGVMNLCSSCTDFSVPVAGSTLSSPDFLHAQMQVEPVPDWTSSGTWVPNWNSSVYLSAWRNLPEASRRWATGSCWPVVR